MRAVLILSCLNMLLNMLLLLYLKSHMVYDMDKIRHIYLDDARVSFQRGCSEGIDYPPEYRAESREFNQHSPTIYCDEKWKESEEYFFGQMMGLSQ